MARPDSQQIRKSSEATLFPGRDDLRERHRQGAGGLEVVQAHSVLVDGVLSEIYEKLASRHGGKAITRKIALVCLGGYGRGELNPHSDIDLMFLLDGEIDEEQQGFVSDCIALLWDLKFHVGHACRTVKDCLRYVRRDVVTANSMLEGRYLVGHRAVYEKFHEEVQENYVRKNRASFVRQKIDSILGRHAKLDYSQFHLEPNIKEGVGGLRDVHSAVWLSRVVHDIRSLDELASFGLIDEFDLATIKVAYDFLLRVRTELHLLAGRKQDILDMNYQREVADHFGFQNTLKKAAVENFMSYYYLNVGNIRRFLEVVMEHVQQDPRVFRQAQRRAVPELLPSPLVLQGDQVFLDGNRDTFFGGESGVQTLMRLVQAAQEHRLTFSDHLCRCIARSIPLVRLQLLYLKNAHQDFWKLLMAPGRIAHVLRMMHDTGLLSAILPELEGITSLYQYDHYHQFTQDEHTLRVLEELEYLAETDEPELASIRGALGEVRHLEVLRLSVLLHDAGKAEGRVEHVRNGVRLASRVCERLDAAPEVTRTVKFLVENHLLMSRLAHRRDINDQETIDHFNGVVGGPEMLHMLYVLTCADIRGVGRGAWTGWKGALLEDLYRKSLITFETGTDAPVSREESIRQRLHQAAPPETAPEEVDQHIALMPERYLSECDPEKMAEHLALIRELGEREFSTSMNRMSSCTEFTICTRDRPGLFAEITGILAGSGLSVWGAQLFTRSDGIALDAFLLLDREGDPVPTSLLDTLNQSFGEVFSGKKRVEDLIRGQERRIVPGALKGTVQPPRIHIDNDSAQSYTIIDVYAQDRVGVLYEISRAISDLGKDIHLAKIATHVDQILDVFYITDRQGNKITDGRELDKIELSLTEVIERDRVSTRLVPAVTTGSK